MRDLDGKVMRELKNTGGGWTVERDYVYRDGAPLATVIGRVVDGEAMIGTFYAVPGG